VLTLTTFRSPAVIVGGGSANGLGIARNLGSLGIPVYCVTSNPREPTLYSKFCTGSACIPHVERDPAILLAFLSRFRQRLSDPGVLFPTTDTALLTVSAILQELHAYVTYISNRDIVETMVIKTQFYQSLHAHDVPHPRTLNFDETTSKESLHELSFPVYLRPAQSLPFFQEFGLKGFVAQNLTEMHKYLGITQEQGLQMMIQEIIPGPTWNGFALNGYMDKYGRVLALIGYQKIRQPSLFSNSIIIRTIPLTRLSSIQDMLITYLQRIGYHGLFGAEFKLDPRDGHYKLLEINARSLGGNNFAAQCGINNILIAYHDALGENVEPVTRYTTDVYKIKYILDLPLLLRRLLRGNLATHDLRPYIQKHVGHIHLHNDALPFLHALRDSLNPRKLTRYLLAS
jgi:predicted ATP-grasp superfamily ATP-dependent carboligase